MAKTIKALVCIIIVPVILCGCWDARNIEDWNIATTIIIDKKQEEFISYVEIASISAIQQNPSSEQGQLTPMTNRIMASGKTLSDMRQNIDRQSNKPLFLGAAQALIMTKSMAEAGIEEYLYRFRQLPDYRKTVDVIVTPDDPEKFLNSKPANVSAVGFSLEETLEALHEKGRTIHVSLMNVMNKLAGRNKAYLLNVVTTKTGQTALDGLAVMNGPKMAGIIPVEQTKGVVFLAADTHITPDFFYVVPIKDQHVTIEARLKNRRIDVEYNGSQLNFTLDLSFEGINLYPEIHTPVTYEDERLANDNIQKIILNDLYHTVELSQKTYGLDYMQFSDAFRIKYPDEYKSIDWQQEFKKAFFTIKVKVDMEIYKVLDYNPYRQ